MKNEIKNYFKIALIGEEDTGKNYLLESLMGKSNNFFSKLFNLNSFEKENLIDGQNLKFKFEIIKEFNLTEIHYDGFALIFNYNDLKSFEKIIEFKKKILSLLENGDKKIYPIIVIQNKTDIENNNEDANLWKLIDNFLKKTNFHFFKIYKNNKINIEESFNNLMKQIKDFYEIKLFPELKKSDLNRTPNSNCIIF